MRELLASEHRIGHRGESTCGAKGHENALLRVAIAPTSKERYRRIFQPFGAGITWNANEWAIAA